MGNHHVREKRRPEAKSAGPRQRTCLNKKCGCRKRECGQSWRGGNLRKGLPNGRPIRLIELGLVAVRRERGSVCNDHRALACADIDGTCPHRRPERQVRGIPSNEASGRPARVRNRKMAVGQSPRLYEGDPAKALKQFKLAADVIAPMLRTAMTSENPWVRLQATDVLCDAAERSGDSGPGLDRTSPGRTPGPRGPHPP